MNIQGSFPSQYIKAADLQGRTVKVTIDRVETEKVGNDDKPILYFQGKDRGMVLNRTNANTISAIYGYETDDWHGGELILFSTMVDFQGRSVEAIRVRVPPQKPAARKVAGTVNGQPVLDDPRTHARPAVPVEDMDGDEVPF